MNNENNNNLNSTNLGSVNLGNVNPQNITNNGVESLDSVEQTTNLNQNPVQNSNPYMAFGPGSESNVNPDLNSQIPPTDNNVDSLSDEPPKKKKSKIGIVIAFILIVLALAGGAVWYFYFRDTSLNPKDVYLTGFNNMKNSYTTISNYQKFTGNAAISGNIDSNKKIDLNLDYGIDKSSSIGNVKFTSKYNSSDLLNGSVSYANSNFYVYLNDIYDKCIAVNNATTTNNNANQLENANKVITTMISTITNSLSDQYFSKSVTQNNYTYNLNLTRENATALDTSVTTTLKSNDEFITAYASLTNKQKTDVINSLNMDNYSKSDLTIMASLVTDRKNNPQTMTIKITANSKIINVTLTNITASGFNYKVSYDDKNYNGEFNFNAVTFKFTCNDGTNNLLSINNTLTPNANVTAPEIKDSVNYNDLTEFDQRLIMIRLGSKEGISKIMQDLSPLLSNTSSTTTSTIE